MDKYSPTYCFMTTPDDADLNLSLSLDTKNAKRTSQRTIPDQGRDNTHLYSTDLKPVTKTIRKNRITKRSYINTSNELRLELIEAVHTTGEKIKYAAKRLGINYSSAKAICQIYKREGRSDKKVPRRTNPRENQTSETHETPVFMSPLGDPLKICVEDMEGEEKDEVPDSETNWTASTQESLTISKGFTSESCLSIPKSEEPMQKPEPLESEEVSKLSFSYEINPSQSLIQNRFIENAQQPLQQAMAYPPPMGYLPIQQPSVYSLTAPNTLLNPLLTQAAQTQFINADPKLLLVHGQTFNPDVSHLMKIKAQLSCVAANVPKTKQDEGLFPDVSYLLKQSLLATQQQPQLHAIYPQGLNLLGGQMGGLPLVANPGLCLPLQNISVAPFSFPQTIYQTPYSQGLPQLTTQANLWNNQFGNVPFTLQNFNGKMF